MYDITILIPTYNRKDLLQKAVNSCLNQSCMKFNLVIIDNCSSDGTIEYLKILQTNYPYIKVIFNQSNIGSLQSGQKALSMIHSKWISILCDDDYLDENFILHSLKILENTEKCIVAVGYHIVNEYGELLKSFVYDRKILDVDNAVCDFLDGKLNFAGISGFFFKNCNDPEHCIVQKLYEYPRGFLTDTMLIMEKILEGDGVELINKVLYYKLEWANNESSFSIDNKLSYFKALLYFGADLKNLANRYSNKLSLKTQHRMSIVMPLSQFFRIVIIPIFFKGIMSFSHVKDFQQLISQHDTRYFWHYYSIVICYPLLTQYTFFMRQMMYRILRKLRDVKNSFS